MCLTGGFALALMVDPSVMAPVLSQPSLPFPIGQARRAARSASDAEFAVVKERAATGCTVLGLRFTEDGAVPADRFATLRLVKNWVMALWGLKSIRHPATRMGFRRPLIRC